MIKLAFIFLLYPCLLCAEIYEYKDGQGHFTYSDIFDSNANNGARLLKIPSQNNRVRFSDATDHLQMEAGTKPIRDETKTPASLTINAPLDQETFWDQEEIMVKLTLSSPLTPEYRLEILLDGIPYKNPIPQLQFILHSLSRGAHTLQAKLLNKKNELLEVSKMITIYVHHR